MANQTKILSELSKIVVEAMGTFSSFKKEIETIVRLKVEKMINKMNLVRRDEFETLKRYAAWSRSERTKTTLFSSGRRRGIAQPNWVQFEPN